MPIRPLTRLVGAVASVESSGVKVYTRKGDDGTTGLYGGGRIPKDDPAPEAYGAVDEAQAALGVARAEVERGSEFDEMLIGLERDLWVLMSELATHPDNRHDVSSRFEPPTEFVVPGENRVAALLDVGRTVVRRAERRSLRAAVPGSHVVPYLNRLSDLLWTLARWQEGTSLTARH